MPNDSRQNATQASEKSPERPKIVENPNKSVAPAQPTGPVNAGSRAGQALTQIEQEALQGTVRVRAIIDGFYIGRRKAGLGPESEFDFPIARLQKDKRTGDYVLPRWMELVSQ